MPTETLTSLLRRSLERNRSSPALRDRSVELSYGELDRVSGSWAQDLQRRGVGRGDRVVILTGNTIESAVLFVSLMRLGAVEVALDASEPPPSLGRILDQVHPRLTICLEEKAERIRPGIPSSIPLMCAESLPRLGGERSTERGEAAELALESEGSAADPALIQYTSGSTGKPKGNVHSQGAIAAVLLGARYIEALSSKRLLLGIPIDHAHGKTCLIEYLVAGAEIDIQPGFLLPSQVSELLDHSQAEILEGPPTLYEMACRDASFCSERLACLGSLRMNSAKPRVALLRELRSRFPTSEIVVRYGLTEVAGPVSRLVWRPDRSVPLESCGQPEPFVSVEVEPDSEVGVSGYARGEIVITSPGRSAGFVDGPQRPWLDSPLPYSTGDIGYLDERGYLFLLGRRNHMIKSAGHRIFPQEIEDIVARLDGVEACAVGGVPDVLLGERIVVWVVCSVPASSESVRSNIDAACQKHLPATRRPQQILFENSLPTTPSGKIHLRALVERAAASEDHRPA